MREIIPWAGEAFAPVQQMLVGNGMVNASPITKSNQIIGGQRVEVRGRWTDCVQYVGDATRGRARAGLCHGGVGLDQIHRPAPTGDNFIR